MHTDHNKTKIERENGNAETNLSPRAHGAIYEEKAKKYLIEQGYTFLDQNVNYPVGELDLVFEQRFGRKTELIFIEVRKRSANSLISAEESIGFTKEVRIRRAIQRFLQKYRGRATTLRIDLIAFEDEELKHYPQFM